MMNLVLPTPADIRAARGFLDWKQSDLAYRCDVNVATIIAIENSKSKPTKELLEKIAEVFMEQGMRFQPQGGFIVDREVVTIYEGLEGYIKTLEDALRVCGPKKKELLFLGNDDKRSSDAVNETYKKLYKADIPFKLLIDEKNDYIVGPLEEYRQVNGDAFFSDDVVLIYDDKIMFIIHGKNYDVKDYAKTKPKHILIHDKEMAETFRRYFYRLWEKGKKPTKSSTKQILFRNKGERN